MARNEGALAAAGDDIDLRILAKTFLHHAAILARPGERESDAVVELPVAALATAGPEAGHLDAQRPAGRAVRAARPEQQVPEPPPALA